MGLTDSIFGPAKLLAFAMAIIIALVVWTSFNTSFMESADLTPSLNVTLTEVTSDITASLALVDYVIPFVVFALLLVSVIFAFKTGSNVIYAVFSIIIWALAMIMSAIFTNVFEQFAANFTSTTASLPILMYIFSNIKWLVLFWLFLITIVMFTRTKEEDASINRGLASSEQVFG